MTEVSFYHLSLSPVERALPALLEKAFEAGHHALVLCSPENIKPYDDTFWTFHPRKFLPHGTKNSKQPADKHPVFISDEYKNVNNSTVLAITDGREIADDNYEKILHVFDGNNEDDLSLARTRWKTYKAAGRNLQYWFQDEKGKWTKKEI